jgi:hypothetical protein
MKTALRFVAGTLLGGLAGSLAGLAWLATERCAGPACAGLAMLPILTGAAGLVVGAIGTLGWILFIRPKPMPKAFRDEAGRKPPA